MSVTPPMFVDAWNEPEELTLPSPPPATVTRVPDTVKAPVPLPWQFVLVPVKAQAPSKLTPPPERRDADGVRAALDLAGLVDGWGSVVRLSRDPDRDFSSLPMLPPVLPDCPNARRSTRKGLIGARRN